VPPGPAHTLLLAAPRPTAPVQLPGHTQSVRDAAPTSERRYAPRAHDNLVSAHNRGWAGSGPGGIGTVGPPPRNAWPRLPSRLELPTQVAHSTRCMGWDKPRRPHIVCCPFLGLAYTLSALRMTRATAVIHLDPGVGFFFFRKVHVVHPLETFVD